MSYCISTIIIIRIEVNNEQQKIIENVITNYNYLLISVINYYYSLHCLQEDEAMEFEKLVCIIHKKNCIEIY